MIGTANSPQIEGAGCIGTLVKLSKKIHTCLLIVQYLTNTVLNTMKMFSDTPPQITYRFIRQTIQPGPSVSLKCVSSGNPTPNIKWTLDGFALPQNER